MSKTEEFDTIAALISVAEGLDEHELRALLYALADMATRRQITLDHALLQPTSTYDGLIKKTSYTRRRRKIQSPYWLKHVTGFDRNVTTMYAIDGKFVGSKYKFGDIPVGDFVVVGWTLNDTKRYLLATRIHGENVQIEHQPGLWVTIDGIRSTNVLMSGSDFHPDIRNAIRSDEFKTVWTMLAEAYL